VCSCRRNTSAGTSALGFRLATALFGSAGIEWDLTQASPAELEQIAAWIAVYKERRDLLHGGTVVHADASDPALELHGVVAMDGASAVFAQVALAAPRTALPAPIRFPGLDRDRRYRVRPLLVGPAPHTMQTIPPAWLADGAADLVLSGAVLADVGLPAPLLTPEQAALFTVDAV
jgi:alpha-galactosidase